MKQEILCIKCGEERKTTIKEYPGESFVFERGKAINDYLCDSCASHVAPGDDCFAFSLWSEMGAIPYYPWEKEYIKEMEA